MIYLAIILALLLLSFRYDYLNRSKGREVGFWIILIVLILVAGLRYRLGQDTIIYMNYFKTLHPLDKLTSVELANSRFGPGFIVLLSLSKYLGIGFLGFQMIHSIVVNSVFLFFLKKHTKHLFFAILIYVVCMYFLLLFQQLRESLAASVFLLAWPALINKRWLIWFPASFLALSFHVSSIFMFIIPLIFIPGIRYFFTFGKRTIICCLCLLILGFIIQTVFFKYIEMIAVTEAMVERASAYSESELSRASFNIGGLISKAFQWFLYPLIAMIVLFGGKYNKTEDSELSEKNPIESFAIISLYISSLCVSIPIIARYNNYFFIFSIIVISEWAFSYILLFRKKIRLQYLYWILIFIPLIGFHSYNFIWGSVNKSGSLKNYMIYYPYSSYLDQEEDQNREKAMRYMIRRVK